jgi:gluconokinase
MGVAGCGKSSLAAAVASAEAAALIEGDDFHSAASRAKMSRGVALTDADRGGWLAALEAQLRAARPGIVLTCSALKRGYRERLRQAAPDLRFVCLRIDREAALKRVAGRSEHFFSAALVDDQFATFESPSGEVGVLMVDALAPLAQLQAEVSAWLHTDDVR